MPSILVAVIYPHAIRALEPLVDIALHLDEELVLTG
jgi:hypothetical protein